MTAANLTREISDNHDITVIRKDGVIVADVIADAEGRGMWVHYFGGSGFKSFGWPRLAADWPDARALIRAAAQ